MKVFLKYIYNKKQGYSYVFVRPILPMLLACVIGVLTYSFSNINLQGAVLIAASFLAVSILFFSKQYIIISLLFFLISFFNSYFYYNLNVKSYKFFEVRVSSVSKTYGVGELSSRKVKLDGLKDSVKPSEVIKVRGVFKKEKDIDRGIVGTLYIDEVLNIKEDYIFKLNNIRRLYFEKLKLILGEEDSALVSSTTLGYTEALTKEQNFDMGRLGIIHVVSVSGFHIALIFLILDRFLKLRYSIPISFVYVLITGATAPTIRAFFMILVLKFSKKVFKNYDGITALSFSALLLILYKPYNAFDIGFMLSHLSTLGIILMYKPFLRFLHKLPRRFNEGISVCLAAQTFSIPYLALTIKDFSINFLIGNVLVLPIFTPLVVLGNIALLFMWNDLIFSLICKVLYINMLVIKGALKITEGISIPNIYLTNIFFYGYVFIIICFYMYKKGFEKFYKIAFGMMFTILIISYGFFPKITVYNEKRNRAIILERGFGKEMITVSKNEYFINKVKKQYAIYDVYKIKEDYGVKIKDINILIDKNTKKCYIKTSKNNDTKLIDCDIIGSDEKVIRIINGRIITSEF
ncbi:competence protein ComEC [Clostridium cavendishii DSM 21758]|uniref:Competence protein ComEC n=1 Tax=Clostridium cavendishii DSM 21758 TaxID=1121302 RepID=A0A1M6APL4_9CLOT|nr:competence protein ComEC [Clostridium cavendishii DSM 21758]